ncbi:hypothetical protein [Bradyrhizobium sp. CCBAU 21365]|uniref:hypothetical protein n=1 Tax=Bradyrhizobium sp. CCBAU 21365 TaxID=1325083 RepID=UPI00188BC2E1|nr:hypothetical protein [Bradyrhizobium sp. CCBAU 21365]
MNPAEAATFMARLEAGESLRSITGGTGQTPICSSRAFKVHCQLHPEWGSKAQALAKANSKSRILAGVKKQVDRRTHCKSGHELTPENTKLRITNRGWRHLECQLCRRGWNTRAHPTAAQVTAAIAVVEEGGTLADATARKSDGGVIRFNGLVAAFRLQPKLEGRLKRLSARNAARKRKKLWSKRKRAAKESARDAARLRMTERIQYPEFPPDVVLRLLEEGCTLRMIFYGARPGQGNKKVCAGISSKKAFNKYCAAHPEWAERATALAEQNAQAANKRKGASQRERTHCIYGHSLHDARVHTRWSTGYTTRQCRTCERIRVKGARPMEPDKLLLVCQALQQKKSLAEITGRPLRGKKRPMISNTERLYCHRRFDPEFDRFVREMIAGSLSRSQILRWSMERARKLTDQRREEANDFETIRAMLPTYLPGRDDIAQNIFVALLEGSLRQDQIKERVREFVAAYDREARKNGTVKFGLRSLDAPLFSDGSATLLDGLSSENYAGWDLSMLASTGRRIGPRRQRN